MLDAAPAPVAAAAAVAVVSVGVGLVGVAGAVVDVAVQDYQLPGWLAAVAAVEAERRIGEGLSWLQCWQQVHLGRWGFQRQRSWQAGAEPT